MSKLKIIVGLITLIAVTIWVVISWDQFSEAYSKMNELTWWIFILQIPLQLGVIIAITHFYYSYFSAVVTTKLKLSDFYKVVLELNFVNTVFPSGGISGFSYLSLRLRNMGVKVATSTLAQSIRFALTFLTFLLFLGIGLIWLAVDGKVDHLVLLIAGSIFMLTIFGGIIFIFLISDKKRIKNFTSWLPKTINKLFSALGYKAKRDLIDISRFERLLEDIHISYVEIMKDKSVLKKPLFWAFMINLLDLVTLYVVFLALGISVNPGSIILAYAVANFAGLIAISPGGVGIYEFLMIGMLTLNGVDKDTALAGAVIYRVVKFIIFVPIGMILYHLAISRNHLQFSTDKPQSTVEVLDNIQSKD